MCVCVCAKGIHFQLSYHTPLSTDMLACFFFVFPEIHVRQTSVPITDATHTAKRPDRVGFSVCYERP